MALTLFVLLLLYEFILLIYPKKKKGRIGIVIEISYPGS